MKHLKKIIIVIFLLYGNAYAQDKISLAGAWQVKLDPHNKGYAAHWWEVPFTQTLKLPGSLAENNLGDDISLVTPWMGDVFDSTFFKAESYKKYRTGDIKVPFWLTPNKYYKGIAWYKRSIEIPQNWSGKQIILNLERCHWETSLYVNGKYCGTQNSLVAPHSYDVSGYLTEKNNVITIRVNNEYILPIGPNSSSITDHTQTNWNGIIGEMSLKAFEKVKLNDIRIFSDIENPSITVKYSIENQSRVSVRGKIGFQVEGFPEMTQGYEFDKKRLDTEINYQLPNAKFWDEFAPNLYTLHIKLYDENGKLIDGFTEKFGVRKVAVKDGRIAINNRPIFLRGDVDCAGFPLTGYPSTNETDWEKIINTAKSYGLNHLRFHSWCPPEAAFKVADRLGLYLYVESPLWANFGSAVGTNSLLDNFIYAESEKILANYGNHPSFIMMSYGNEPAGINQNAFFADWVTHFKAKDNRRLYTSAAGWPHLPTNDFHIAHKEVRIQGWEQGLASIINSKQPATNYDWRVEATRLGKSVVSHEIGQWCAYPNLKEISKYTGVLKAKNFEIFKETLEESGMANQAEEFLHSSGKLQTLCYKADIEAALRTPNFGGFQLLGLHDFSGQGTALVGALDAFWESKGYTSPEEYRTFCNSTVLLAKFPKLTFTNNETATIPLDVAHFGSSDLAHATIEWKLVETNGKTLLSGTFQKEEIKTGDTHFIGNMALAFSKIKEAKQLQLKVNIANTDIQNVWDIWVYPKNVRINTGNVLVVNQLDDEVIAKLNAGQTVLYLANGDVREDKGAKIAIGFSSIFWNTAWTNGQAPHTMGLVIDPKQAIFKDFPTEEYSNYQWFDLITKSQAMILNDFDKDYRPILQPIDTWFENRKLAIGFETKVGKGKLMVCSIDLDTDIENRIVAKQFKYSLLNYMNSKDFSPKFSMDIQKIKMLFK